MILDLLDEILFPRCCACCSVEIESGFLCRDCRRGFLQMRPFPAIDFLDGGVSVFSYEREIKQAIHEIKFASDQRRLKQLAGEVEMLMQDVSVQNIIIKFSTDAGNLPLHDEHYNNCTVTSGPQGSSGCPIWCGVPTDPSRLRKRGFDIPSTLFSERAKEFGGIWKPVLCRTRKTLPMYGLKPEERVRNLKDCFAVTGDVGGKSVILVDDIFTTGTTFSAAAAALKKAGASSVKGLAFCSSLENLR